MLFSYARYATLPREIVSSPPLYVGHQSADGTVDDNVGGACRRELFFSASPACRAKPNDGKLRRHGDQFGWL
jgi:hypothetical protein